MAANCGSKTKVEITKWCCNTPLDKGCVSHNGHLYVNLVDGNEIEPELGVADGTYAGAFDMCGLINYLSGNNDTFGIAVDNGDGTGSFTNPDGTVVPFCAVCPVPVTYTFEVNEAGDIVSTPSDGSDPTVLVIDHPDDVDRVYTGYTLIDGILTETYVDSNGDPLPDVVQDLSDLISAAPTPDTDNKLVMLFDADGNVTGFQEVDIDGNDVGSPQYLSTQPNDLTRSIASGHPATAGLSLGQVNKPLSSAALRSDMDGADEGLEVSYKSMVALFSNRAAEAGTAGMMNTDGSLGGYMINQGTVQPNAIIPTNLNNNFWIRLDGPSGGASANANYTLAAGQYSGQLVTIHAPFESRIGAMGEVTLTTGAIGGISRPLTGAASSNEVGTVDSGDTVLTLRPNEVITLIWRGVWRIVQHNYNQFHGTNYSEDENGYVTVWGNSPFNAAVFPAFQQLPTIVTDIANGTFVGNGGILNV